MDITLSGLFVCKLPRKLPGVTLKFYVVAMFRIYNIEITLSTTYQDVGGWTILKWILER
jgi:hypothetical protein